MELEKTVERIVPKNFKSREEYLLYLRHVFAYEQLKPRLEKSDKVLEIGFGEGYGTHLIAKKVQSVIGIDVNQEAVDYANEKYASSNCKFQQYEGDELPFESYFFDKIITYQVIEHIEDDEQFLREIHKVLKTGGQLFLTTPNRIHRLEPGQEPWNPFHVREYAPEQLNILMSNIFSEVNVYGVNAEPDVRQIEIDRVKRGITLKKLMPNSLKRLIYGDFIQKYNTGSFFLDDEDPSRGLDLFAICTK